MPAISTLVFCPLLKFWANQRGLRFNNFYLLVGSQSHARIFLLLLISGGSRVRCAIIWRKKWLLVLNLLILVRGGFILWESYYSDRNEWWGINLIIINFIKFHTNGLFIFQQTNKYSRQQSLQTVTIQTELRRTLFEKNRFKVILFLYGNFFYKLL